MLWCTLRCPRKNDVRFVFITICFVWNSCFIDIFVLIYVYWCPTRFLYQMMLVSFNGNTTGDTRGAGTANPSGSPVFVHPRFLWGSCWSIFSFLWSVFLIIVCLFVLNLLSIALSVGFRFTAYDYPKLFIHNYIFEMSLIFNRHGINLIRNISAMNTFLLG